MTQPAAQSAFTPGPWQFVPWHIEEGPSAVRAPDGWTICTTSSDDDARLIAAAPVMLEALQVAAWLLADISPDGLVRKQVDAAIAKATGSR